MENEMKLTEESLPHLKVLIVSKNDQADGPFKEILDHNENTLFRAEKTFAIHMVYEFLENQDFDALVLNCINFEEKILDRLGSLAKKMAKSANSCCS